jgi:hypothetical protein
MIDPEFYAPSLIPDHRKITQVIDTTRALGNREVVNVVIGDYLSQQQKLGATEFLIPVNSVTAIDFTWLDTISMLVQESQNWMEKTAVKKPLYVTIAVSQDVISSDISRNALLNRLVGLDVDGYYLAIELPNSANHGPTDAGFICNLVEMIFRLKMQNKKVILSRSGYWTMLAFPFGLDCFTSGPREASRSFQLETFRPRKDKKFIPNSKSRHVWINGLMSTVRLPEEAELLHEQGLWKELDNGSPYANLFDGTPPSEIFENNDFSPTDSLLNYTWQIWDMGEKFRGLGCDERIDLVRTWLARALTWHSKKQDRGFSSGTNYAQIFAIWLSAFDHSIDELGDELRYEFS